MMKVKQRNDHPDYFTNWQWTYGIAYNSPDYTSKEGKLTVQSRLSDEDLSYDVIEIEVFDGKK